MAGTLINIVDFVTHINLYSNLVMDKNIFVQENKTTGLPE